jgi:hypothetical protein
MYVFGTRSRSFLIHKKKKRNDSNKRVTTTTLDNDEMLDDEGEGDDDVYDAYSVHSKPNRTRNRRQSNVA